MVLGLGGAGTGGLLGGYFCGLKGGLTGGVTGGLAGYTLGSLIDNTSTLGRACGTIAKGANLTKFVKYLNEQNIWGKQEEQYEPDNKTPIHKYLNIVKKEIDEEYVEGDENTSIRDLKVEWDESKPEIYKIKSYSQEITLRLKGCTAKQGEEIDFSKINKIHIEHYNKYDSRHSDKGLNIDFPHNEEGLKEAIRTANLTNKMVARYRLEGSEDYPFYYGSAGGNGITKSLKISVSRTWSNPDGSTTILSKQACKDKFPTLLKDMEKYSQVGSVWLGIKQKDLHNQAINDESKGSQYIKFLHQIGKGHFWKKI